MIQRLLKWKATSTHVEFCLIQLSFLFFLTLSSLFGAHLLGPLSLCFWMTLFMWAWSTWTKNLKRIDTHPNLMKPFRGDAIGWILFLIGAAWAIWVLGDTWVTPSQDDTLNHLGFLQTLLESQSNLLGRINRPGMQWFGTSPYHFYPTGSHSLLALWIYPGMKLGLDWVVLLKWIFIFMLALWPASLWWGSRRVFPNIPHSIRFFCVIATFTQSSFPLAPLGEGGISRIVALLFFVPFWFEILKKPNSMRLGFLSAAIAAPLFFFIHPSLIPWLGLGFCFVPRRTMIGALLGSILGGLFVRALLHSVAMDILHPSFIETISSSFRFNWISVIDRLKGPVHDWFADPMGFFKFLSPKNILIYLGILLSLWHCILSLLNQFLPSSKKMILDLQIPKKLILLFLTPFFFTELSLIPHPWAQRLGLIFYHSTKRIAELTPLLGFTFAIFSAHWITHRFIRPSFLSAKKKFALITTPLAFSFSFFVLFCVRSEHDLEHYHQLFHTVKTSQIHAVQNKFETLQPHAELIIDRHDYDWLRYALKKHPVYTFVPECGEVGSPSLYCQQRRDFAKKVMNTVPSFSASPELWWLPPEALDTQEAARALLRQRPLIELDARAHLIRLN